MADQPSSIFSEEQTPTQATEQEQPPTNGPANPVPEGGSIPETKPQETQQPPQQSDNVWADQLASIKNESGQPKYRDLPTALDALRHSQEYIPALKSENESLKGEVERLKSELEQRGSLEETVDRLTKAPEAQTPQEFKGLTEEQVRGLLEQQLSEREQQQTAVSNLQQVEQSLVSQYGDKAAEMVKTKAQEYGMTVQQMRDLASQNPKMVQALFGAKPSPQGKPTSSSVNMPPIAPQGDDELTRPQKSLLSGASHTDQAEYMRKIKERVYKQYNVET